MANKTYIALLRGINVGGKNSLPMADLAAMFEAAGCQSVRTYIQSGNVVFDASQAIAAKVPAVISAAISRQRGFESPVILRSGAELREAAKRNPFVKAPAEHLHVAFLDSDPGALAATLEPNRSPGDSFRVDGREIFLHCPKGYGKTKLTNAWFDSRLKTTSTVRNWKTVLKLLELSGA